MLSALPLRPPPEKTARTRLALHLAVSILLASVTASVAARAGATLITYTDRTTWQSAVGALSGTEDFNSFASDTSFQSTEVALNNMTVTGTTGTNGVFTQKIDAAPFQFPGFYVLDNTSYLLSDVTGSAEFVRFDFGNLVTAWGADFSGVSDNPRDTRINVYDASDILLGTVLMSSPTNTTQSFY